MLRVLPRPSTDTPAPDARRGTHQHTHTHAYTGRLPATGRTPNASGLLPGAGVHALSFTYSTACGDSVSFVARLRFWPPPVLKKADAQHFE